MFWIGLLARKGVVTCCTYCSILPRKLPTPRQLIIAYGSAYPETSSKRLNGLRSDTWCPERRRKGKRKVQDGPVPQNVCQTTGSGEMAVKALFTNGIISFVYVWNQGLGFHVTCVYFICKVRSIGA